VTGEELDRKICELLEVDLNLEDGEMVMPLKRHEIDELHRDIRYLVNDAIREAVR
jgi:hypothetical protein